MWTCVLIRKETQRHGHLRENAGGMREGKAIAVNQRMPCASGNYWKRQRRILTYGTIISSSLKPPGL